MREQPNIAEEGEGRTVDAMARCFAGFARLECAGRSVLYARLSLGIAEDPAVLEIATRTRSGQPAPNLLFGAVHFLLLQGAEDPLAAFYPSVARAPLAGDPIPAFHDFCLAHTAAIAAILRERMVQTAHARRCACLLPAFGLVAEQAGERPLALIEVGASAGLNLIWDRYGYRFSDGRRCGSLAAPLQLTCEVRGAIAPPLPAALPAVAWRVGLDLNPIDVCDPNQTLWLQALIWPDEPGRAALLREALAVAQTDPPPLIAGDALETLPGAIAEAPADATLCIYHSHTLNQFSRQAREGFYELIQENAQRRPIAVLGMEAPDGGDPLIDLRWYGPQGERYDRLARCDAHGAWLAWHWEGRGKQPRTAAID